MRIRLLVLFVPLFWLHSVCAQAQSVSPQEWLNVRGTELLKVLAEPEATKRFSNTLRLADNVFNAKELARLALGRYWIEFSDEQKAHYSDLFLKYFVVTYASSRLPLDSVSFTIGDAVPSGKDVLVKTVVGWSGDTGELQNEITGTSSQNVDSGIELVFALRKTGDGYYIRDFQLAGKSVLLFLRGKLERMFIGSDYSPDKMIADMEKNVQTKIMNAETIDRMNKMKERRNSSAAP